MLHAGLANSHNSGMYFISRNHTGESNPEIYTIFFSFHFPSIAQHKPSRCGMVSTFTSRCDCKECVQHFPSQAHPHIASLRSAHVSVFNTPHSVSRCVPASMSPDVRLASSHRDPPRFAFFPRVTAEAGQRAQSDRARRPTSLASRDV